MEQAAKQGTLDKSALAVPYGNLAAMHRKLGADDLAKQYQELAARAEERKAEITLRRNCDETLPWLGLSGGRWASVGRGVEFLPAHERRFAAGRRLGERRMPTSSPS